MKSETDVRMVEFIQHNDSRGQHTNRKTRFMLVNVAGKCKIKVKKCGGGGRKPIVWIALI